MMTIWQQLEQLVLLLREKIHPIASVEFHMDLPHSLMLDPMFRIRAHWETFDFHWEYRFTAKTFPPDFDAEDLADYLSGMANAAFSQHEVKEA